VHVRSRERDEHATRARRGDDFIHAKKRFPSAKRACGSLGS
jgi:hypothetical protein